MIKRIRISNFRGIDTPKEISFEANPKRKADKLGITKTNGKEILLVVGLLGKNASGKTSFANGIEFIEDIASGFFYKKTLSHLKYMVKRKKDRMQKNQNKIIKNDSKLEPNIRFDTIMSHIRINEFNDPTKPMEFLIEFIDSKNIIKLEIILLTNGMIKEKIEKNNAVFSEQKVSLQDFKSKIYDKKLVFKRVTFISNNYWEWRFDIWMDPFIFSRYKNKKNQLSNKMKLLKWIRIADDKIKRIVWTSKNEIEKFVIVNNNGEKIITFSQLSSGTRKWMELGLVFLEALFIKQSFIFIDEIEKFLHPSLVKFLIALTNDLKVNKKRSQFFFTSHSPLAVDMPFRKDAINYIDNTSKIVNLGKLGVREDVNFSKNFLAEKLSSHPTKSDMFDFISDSYV